MTENPTKIALKGTAELEFVDEVLTALEGLFASVGDIAEEDRTFFSLAVSEIATNICTHHNMDRPVAVSAELTVTATALRAQFHDDADPADPAVIHLEGATLPEDLAESGRGLAIAKMALDHLSHEVADGHVWTLMKKRRQPR